jgi:hypothetical protein
MSRHRRHRALLVATLILVCLVAGAIVAYVVFIAR